MMWRKSKIIWFRHLWNNLAMGLSFLFWNSWQPFQDEVKSCNPQRCTLLVIIKGCFLYGKLTAKFSSTKTSGKKNKNQNKTNKWKKKDWLLTNTCVCPHSIYLLWPHGNFGTGWLFFLLITESKQMMWNAPLSPINMLETFSKRMHGYKQVQ